jgi:hypothetical protein
MVNMDETAVERLIPHRQGNSMVFRPMSVAAGHVYERIARRDSHGHVTLMGCVSSVPELQIVLPQFILANDARISRAEALKLRSLRAPLLWLEGCAGWLNSESFCLILVMYRTASNRFVSRSSRLLYFLSVSDTFCRSIIHFTDQKDDGLFALFFATVRL